MKRIAVLLCFMLFAGGVVISPAVHRIHLAECNSHDECDPHARHDESTCTVCQIAATALTTPCVHIAPISATPIHQLTNTPQAQPVDTSITSIHSARAPPAC